MSEAGAANVAPEAGLVSDTLGGTLIGGAVVTAQASTSAIRLYMFIALVTKMRIFEVEIGLKVTRRHTRLLAVTVPPGTVSHAEPVQYCTWKSRSPFRLNVVVGVGKTADVWTSGTVKISTSSIVLTSLKATSSQSG